MKLADMLPLAQKTLVLQAEHWQGQFFLATVRQGVAQLLEPEKALAIGYFDREELEHLPSIADLMSEVAAISDQSNLFRCLES